MQIRSQMPNLGNMADLSGTIQQSMLSLNYVLLHQLHQQIMDLLILFLIIALQVDVIVIFIFTVGSQLCQYINSVFDPYRPNKVLHVGVQLEFRLALNTVQTLHRTVLFDQKVPARNGNHPQFGIRNLGCPGLLLSFIIQLSFLLLSFSSFIITWTSIF